MPNGKIHYIYYKKGFWIALPIGILASFYDLKFGVGYILGYWMGRYI